MNTNKMIFKLILLACCFFSSVAASSLSAAQSVPASMLLYGGSEASNYFVSDASTATALGSISGTVTDGTNLVSGIAVYVKDHNYNYISGATTDTAGNYTVADIPTGSYKVEFDGSGSGYVIQWYNNKPDFNTADPVSVTEPSTTIGINATLVSANTTLVSANTTLGGVPAEGNLKITIYDSGRIAVYRYITGAWQEQIYSGDNKGSRLEIKGVGYSLGYYAGTPAALVSNIKVSDTKITSVWVAGGTRITLDTTYQPGASYFGMQWTITNESGGSLSDLRFFHGEDTYFYNSDYGGGFWDAPNNTVGVQKTISGQLMRMSLQAITVPYAYDSMYFGTVWSNVGVGALTSYIDSLDSTDNGYALEWRNASMQNGETWTISTYEKFADVAIGSVSVTAPTQTDCSIGSTCSLTFTVTNISQASATVSLSVNSSQTDWNAQILTPVSPVVIQVGSSQQVNVQVSIPASAMDGAIGNVTLSASDGTNTAIDVAAVIAVSNTYTITTSAGAGGTVSCSPATVSYGSSSICTITPNTGSAIHDVLVDGASAGAIITYTFSNVTTNHTISATFLITTYTVTPSAGAGGTIIPSTPQTVGHNATISFTVMHDDGYTASVGGTCSGILVGNTYTTLPITFDCTVVVSFTAITPNSYTVTSISGTGGSISPSSATVNSGNTTSFIVTPDTGYSIASVTGCNGTLSGSTYTTGPITANCTVLATFRDTFTITTPTGTVEIKAGGTFRISTTGASNVIVDGVPIGAVNIVTFINITGPHTITW